MPATTAVTPVSTGSRRQASAADSKPPGFTPRTLMVGDPEDGQDAESRRHPQPGTDRLP
jgi:hypothetical protein